MNPRTAVHQVLEGQHATLGTPVRLFLALLVLLNAAAVVLQTVPALDARHGAAFAAFETASLAIFGTEYLLRLWSCAEHARYAGLLGRLRWVVTPGALVDLLAIAPGLVPASDVDLRVLRMLRLARLVRVVKLGRYSLALRTLRHVLTARLPDLVSLAFVLLILLVLSSAAMFHLEHDAQPDAFSSIPATMWWGIVTLTTIGYGDMAPVTVEGRTLGAVVAVLGIGMFALPAGLLGGAFVEELQKARSAPPAAPAGSAVAPTHCPHCQKPLDA